MIQNSSFNYAIKHLKIYYLIKGKKMILILLI